MDMKKFLLIILTLLTLCGSMMFISCGASKSSEEFTYHLLGDKKDYYGISLNNLKDEDVVIPSTHEGLPVLSIMDNGFKNSKIKTVTIPDSIMLVGKSAFYNCDKLTAIRLGANSKLDRIKEYAFADCDNLASVSLPTAVKYIERNAFYSCDNLANIDLSNVTGKDSIIGDYAFAYCPKLTELNVQAHKVGNNTFYGSGLKKITLGSSAESIGLNILGGCDSLEEMRLSFLEENSSEKKYLGYFFGANSYEQNAKYVPSSLKKVTIFGEEVIYSKTFYNTAITELIIESGTKKIEDNAFEGCTKLSSIYLCDSITEIGNTFADTAFYKNQSNWSDGYLYKGSFLIAVNPAQETDTVAVKDGTKIIANSAFNSCTNVKTVVIPNTVTNMTGGLLKGLTKLESLTLPFVGANATDDNPLGFLFGNADATTQTSAVPKTLAKITVTKDCNLKKAFYGLPIREAELMEGETVEQEAFKNCASLTRITIPSSVTSIQTDAFAGCLRLVEICNKSGSLAITAGKEDNGSIGKYALNIYKNGTSKLSTDANGFVKYNSGSEELIIDYVGTNAEITLPTTATEVRKYALRDNATITKLTVPSNISMIGLEAFASCPKLKEVVINGVKLMDAYCFSNCTALANITLSNTTETIGDCAFSGDTSLKEITIPKNVRSFGRSALFSCTSLEKITVEDANANYCSIDGSLYNKDKTVLIQYAQASKMEAFEVPASVTRIEENAFSLIRKLKTLTFSSNVVEIGKNAFENATVLNEVKFKGAISDWAKISFANENANPFAYANTMYINGEKQEKEALNIPATVNEIKDYAFYNCDWISSVELADSVIIIGRKAFANCSNLSKFTVGAGVKIIEEYAFELCTSLGEVTFNTTSGWYRTKVSTATGGTDMDVSSKETNATNLVTNYKDYYWMRNA